MDAKTPVRVIPVPCAPKKAPCPSCGKLGRRKRTHQRDVRTIAYKEICILRITYGEYESRCECCKSFRTHPDDVLPKAKYDNKVREAVLGKGASAWLRQALVDCRALIVILTPQGLPPDAGIKIGAAWIARKPIYAVTTRSDVEIPPALARAGVLQFDELDDLIEAVRQLLPPSTERKTVRNGRISTSKQVQARAMV